VFDGASMKTNGSQINGCYFHRTCIIWSMSNFVENVCFLDFLCPVLTTVYTIDIFLMRLFIFPSSSHKRTFSLLHFLSAGVSLVKFLKRWVKALRTLDMWELQRLDCWDIWARRFNVRRGISGEWGICHTRWRI
jgi:hypothetical protein